MKKTLTLSIALILVAGLISLAKTTDIGTNVSVSQATDYAEDRNVVQRSNGTIFTTDPNNVVGDLTQFVSEQPIDSDHWDDINEASSNRTVLDEFWATMWNFCSVYPQIFIF